MMTIKNIPWQQTIPLRHQVLWPDKPPEYCHIEGDEEAMHFCTYLDDNLVCVASVYIEENRARLRKFATVESHQGRGIGSQMINHILEQLKSTEIHIFWCDARESALRFYQRFDMETMGERFYKGDIAYFKMQVCL